MKKQEINKKIKELEEEIKKLKKSTKRQKWWNVWFAWEIKTKYKNRLP